MQAIGTHYIWDIHQVDGSQISYQKDVRQQLLTLIECTPLHVVSQQYKQFDPVGVTGILLLSESHMSIHTWPEHRYVAIDLFSCVEINVAKMTSLIKTLYKTDSVQLKTIDRGVPVAALSSK